MILDCPPALSPACAAAIAASTDVIIPIKLDAYSVRGMNELTAQIERLRRIYPDVHIAGCLPTVWYKSDTVEQGEILLRQHAPCKVFTTHIRRSPKVDESTWTGEPVVSWSPRSAAARTTGPSWRSCWERRSAMARKFDITAAFAAAVGDVSKLGHTSGGHRVHPADGSGRGPGNFYSLDGIEELAANIQLCGAPAAAAGPAGGGCAVHHRLRAPAAGGPLSWRRRTRSGGARRPASWSGMRRPRSSGS